MADENVLTFERARRRLLDRPQPPAAVFERAHNFRPADELAQWARATFIEAGGALFDVEHEHLETASIGWLWASGLCEARGGKRVLGTCEIVGQGERKTWGAQRHALQIRDWFDHLPDFIITIDAYAAQEMSDRAWCRLVQHELRHAGQARDADGLPRFTKQGRPVFELKPHDLEIFVGDVARYGAEGDCGLERLAAAVRAGPSVDDRDLWMACGTCANKGSKAA